jgi:hypothetical protein
MVAVEQCPSCNQPACPVCPTYLTISQPVDPATHIEPQSSRLSDMARTSHVLVGMFLATASASEEGLLHVDVDLTSPTTPFPHYFSKCLGSGHALLTLREDWRKTVARARTEIGVENVRFHGLLNDDMVSATDWH